MGAGAATPAIPAAGGGGGSAPRAAGGGGGGVPSGADRTSVGGHGASSTESNVAREVGTRSLNDAAPSGTDANNDGIADTVPMRDQPAAAPAQ